MELNTAALYKMFQAVRDVVRTTIGERHRTTPVLLLQAMAARWNRLTMPAIRIFQALLAGTYRPRAPRQASPAGAAPPRAQRPPQLEEMKCPDWLVRLTPWDSKYRYAAAWGVG